MAKAPALFLDRDGVINREKEYVHRREDFEFIDGVFAACRNARAMGGPQRAPGQMVDEGSVRTERLQGLSRGADPVGNLRYEVATQDSDRAEARPHDRGR